MEKEILEKIKGLKNLENKFKYITNYGVCYIKYINNKLILYKFEENPVWKNYGCKEALSNQLNLISKKLSKL